MRILPHRRVVLDGKQTGELANCRDAFKLLLERASEVAIEDVSPNRFRTCAM